MRDALRLAIVTGDIEAVKILIKSEDINQPIDADGHTPIYFSAMRGQLEITKLLLRSGADTNYNGHEGGLEIHLRDSGFEEVANLVAEVDVLRKLSPEMYVDLRASGSVFDREFVVNSFLEGGLSVGAVANTRAGTVSPSEQVAVADDSSHYRRSKKDSCCSIS